jgi:uncharacterized protein (TIGR03083 family)
VSPLEAAEPTRFEILRELRNERRRTLALLRDLPPEAFDAPATPGWRVRDVVAHLVTTDRATVFGRNIPLVLGSDPSRLERWNDRVVRGWADKPIVSLLLGLERWGMRSERLLRRIPRRAYRVMLPTLWGRVPAAYVAWVRGYDEFVHRQDIRRALGLQDEQIDATSVVDLILSIQRFHAMPAMSRLGAVAVSVSDEPLPEWIYDPAAGVAGPRQDGEQADAHISIAATLLIMTVAGRDSLDQAGSSGGLTIEGDTLLARDFLTKARMV